MQTTTAAQAKPKSLWFALHLIGMGIVSLANPRIYSSDDPVRAWLETWLFPIAIALAAYGLYALLLTKRAKQAWPKSFFILAWVLLALLSPWVSTLRTSANTAQVQQPLQAPAQ
ncbi:hypothetical protein F3J24_04615 [Comamonas sp. Tr-654]|uniref:hypothetical protein n=1 Tax=Comamonas sp. Tr-654 TaxID=2608341 RepID=UPI00141EE737|nr:hypothetical protein [Comamonas sp. Tr-654]NIF82790.1 hypothetical protein [Comamonas sp. Tr-654]